MILDVQFGGRLVVVCGGAAAALPVITRLLADGAQVLVLAEQVSTTLTALPGRPGLQLERRSYTIEDLDRAALVVTATGDPTTDAEIARQATARNRAVLVTAAERPDVRPSPGRVVLVGGGPGPAGLLTVAGQQAIRDADVIICDRLAPLEALAEARPDAEILDVAKIPRGEHTTQARINELLVEHAGRGRTVVRLKGGDSFVFGRGGEEWQACAAAGLPVEVIPGVSSALAAPALAGIPLTHRQLTQGFTVVSAHLPPGHEGSTLNWAALARTNTTLVIMMGVATLPAVVSELLRHGMDPATPAMSVADAGLPGQRTAHAPLVELPEASRTAGVAAPAISVIGAVAGFRPV